jgi:hypothetical protein
MTTTTLQPREGCDRCYCGAKYWENDRCVSCGERWHPIIIGITAEQGISHVCVPGGVLTVETAVRGLAEDDYGGDLRDDARRYDALTGSTTHVATFTDPDHAQEFADAVHLNWPRLTCEEIIP